MRFRTWVHRATLPLGFLGMVVLVGLIECALGRFIRHSDQICGVWRDAGRDATSPEVIESEVLCLGDSQGMNGFCPPILEARLGRPAFNLGVMAGQSSTSYFLLRRALEAGARPRAVLIDFNWDMMKQGPTVNTERWAALLNRREVCELCLEAKETDLAGGLLLRRVLRSLEGRNAVRAAIEGRHEDLMQKRRSIVRNRRLNRGAFILPDNPVLRDPVIDAAPSAFESVGGHQVNAVYLRKLFTLAASRGITVYWVLMPCAPNRQAYRDLHDLDKLQERSARRLLEEFPNLVVLDGHHSRYGLDTFWDATHLSRRGSSALSVAVGAVVARDLAGGPRTERWERLADYQPTALALGIEEHGQSTAEIIRRFSSTRK